MPKISLSVINSQFSFQNLKPAVSSPLITLTLPGIRNGSASTYPAVMPLPVKVSASPSAFMLLLIIITGTMPSFSQPRKSPAKSSVLRLYGATVRTGILICIKALK